MSTVLPSAEEMRERNQLSTRYRNQQKLDKIAEQVRGIRISINFLIDKERELIAEGEKLKPGAQS